MSPKGSNSQTTPYGNPEHHFDACALVIAAGATHVARYPTARPRTLIKGIKAAIEHKGLSFLHIISQCPTQTGRYIYGLTQPAEYLQMIQQKSITLNAAKKLSDDELQGKIVTGILHQSDDKPEVVEELNRIKMENSHEC